MPRTKLDRPKGPEYPPLDWTMGAILCRRKQLHLTWEEVAEDIGMSGDSLRKLVATKATDEWPQYTLRQVCKRLHLDYKNGYIVGGPEDKNRTDGTEKTEGTGQADGKKRSRASR